MAEVHYKKRTFFWQALLILLPVVTLAAVGFFSLRQDRILAQHEAVERAQTIADNLLPKLIGPLDSAKDSQGQQSHSFEVDNAGRLIFPPPVATVPEPKPFNLANLTPEQQRFWNA